MANTLGSPTMGFQSFGRQEGGSPTDGLTPCWFASTDAGTVFRGDAVVTSSGGGTNLSGNYITSIMNGPNTTWMTPVRSRRSININLPWSRRLATQPYSVTSLPTMSFVSMIEISFMCSYYRIFSEKEKRDFRTKAPPRRSFGSEVPLFFFRKYAIVRTHEGDFYH